MCVSALSLVACATTEVADEIEVAAISTSLPAQTLEVGQCGMFGYDTATPPNFIFFAISGQAHYLSAPGTVDVLTTDDTFPGADYGDVQLDFGPAEALIDGSRYAGARLTETLDDGFTRVRPLVILQTCQSDPALQARG